MQHILSHNKEDSNNVCVELIFLLTRLTSLLTVSTDPSPLQSSRKCSVFSLFGTTTVFNWVKWKWQKMDDGRCPTGGAVHPMLEPPVTGDRHAGWHRAEQSLRLMKNIWSSLFLWVNCVAFWKQLQSNHTQWVAAAFGLNPLAKVPQQAIFILPPFWSCLDLLFFWFFGSLNFNNPSQRRTIQTFPERFSLFEYSVFAFFFVLKKSSLFNFWPFLSLERF